MVSAAFIIPDIAAFSALDAFIPVALHLGYAARYCTCFIENNCADPARILKGMCRCEQDAVACTKPHPDRD